MDFYTAILRQSADDWVALCLENGIVGQGETQDGAMAKLKEAIESVQTMREPSFDVYSAPLALKELHEFLTVESREPTSEVYELRAVYA